MSLFSQITIPDWYFVCMINSRFISFYVDDFINNTSHFQINDARQLPIIIPTEDKLKEFEILFLSVIEIKEQQALSLISLNKAETKFIYIQEKLDDMVDKLYRIYSI